MIILAHLVLVATAAFLVTAFLSADDGDKACSGCFAVILLMLIGWLSGSSLVAVVKYWSS